MTAITKRIVSNGHGALNGFTHIVIHETANPGATAQNHVDYWSNNDEYAVHAVCDWDNIFNTVPYDRLCWHVGNANGWTIGIEICHAMNKIDFERAWNNAITWTKAMMKKYGIPASRVVSHDYCSRVWGGSDHTDPIDYFAEYGKTWNDFIKALGGSTPKPKPVKVDPKQPKYRVYVSGGWLDEMVGKVDTSGSGDTYAGLYGDPIKFFACNAKKYRVRVRNAAGRKYWLPWVTKYKPSDLDNGCAGDGNPIIAIEVADPTIKFRVHTINDGWLPWMIGQKDTSGTTDKFAGDGSKIDAVQMVRK